jgi:hypothetical protein
MKFYQRRHLSESESAAYNEEWPNRPDSAF